MVFYHEISQNKKLGRGECEAIAYCLNTSSTFITNDRKARQVASEYGITVTSLPALLKVMIKKNIRTREEVKKILDEMKISDNYTLNPAIEREIFQ